MNYWIIKNKIYSLSLGTADFFFIEKFQNYVSSI